jgi:hypothetical protein
MTTLVSVALFACNNKKPTVQQAINELPNSEKNKVLNSPTPEDQIDLRPCEPRGENPPSKKLRVVSGGVLNGRVVCGELPAFDTRHRPAAQITVYVVFDENGFATNASCGVRDKEIAVAARTAAKKTRVIPSLRGGEPISIRGVLIYSYSPERGIWLQWERPKQSNLF